ncbi:uncharacterized protein LOC124915342 [Impatiens glandulifera]|uniref:uncharacterized protein LOC124915342 n=1 Tax=Impatiens glandulifera TaxID=253017 RepID=UPI001FB0C856|nr:uncharacterized protein LOC124915342 [Impatiens glandulifera]
MAKKTQMGNKNKNKKTPKLHQIDLIPKFSHQRRSPGGHKPRTDFSFFFCSSSSSSTLGFLPDASNEDKKGENVNKMGISSSDEAPVEKKVMGHLQKKKVRRNFYKQTSDDDVDCLKLTPERSHIQEDKWDSSRSSRIESDGGPDTRRSKRDRKPRVHFDELSLPEKPTRKVRRYRIMRLLGLAAPIGSPFTIPSL